MTRIGLLAGLLILQLALALGLALPHWRAKTEAAPLFALEPASVVRVVVEGPEDARVVLAREDGHWILPNREQFPADGERITRLLARLADLRPGAPVARTAAAHERFRVASQAFERRLTLERSEGGSLILYLGTSPALRQVYARLEGRDEVYLVPLETWDIPTAAADWEDKGLLAIPAEEIAKIALPGLDLVRRSADERGAARWTAEGIADGERLDQGAVQKLVTAIAELRFAEALGRKREAEYGLDAPALTFTLTRKDGTARRYRIGKAGEEVYLAVSDRPELFRLARWTADSLLEAARREALLAKEEPAGAAPQARAPGEAAASAPAASPPAAEAPGGG